jgi:hypothetical protein
VRLFLLKKIPLWKRKCETVGCRDARAISFVAKVRVEVFAYFHAVAVKRHSSMPNWLFGLPGRILYEQSTWCQRQLQPCSWLWAFGARLKLSSPKSLLIIASVSALLSRFEQNLIHFFRRINDEIALGQIHYSKKKDVQSHHFHPAAWNFVHWLPRNASTIIHRCIALLQLRIDGSASPKNYGYPSYNRLFYVSVVLCVGGGHATDWSPSRQSYRLCIGLRNWKSGQGLTKGSWAIDE